MSPTLRLLAALALGATCSACIQAESIDPMMKQPKYKAYAPNPLFADGRAMRPPPPNTIPREKVAGDFALTRGVGDEGKVKNFPLPVTRELLELGHKKWDIHCGVCHGLAGDGKSLVASQMSLRPPPNLIERKDLVNGHIYEVTTWGFGLMPGYGEWLTVEERWAIVAYVRALQRAGEGKLSEATPEGRAQLEKEKP